MVCAPASHTVGLEKAGNLGRRCNAPIAQTSAGTNDPMTGTAQRTERPVRRRRSFQATRRGNIRRSMLRRTLRTDPPPASNREISPLLKGRRPGDIAPRCLPASSVRMNRMSRKRMRRVIDECVETRNTTATPEGGLGTMDALSQDSMSLYYIVLALAMAFMLSRITMRRQQKTRGSLLGEPLSVDHLLKKRRK